jgi:hypothetical protein
LVHCRSAYGPFDNDQKEGECPNENGSQATDSRENLTLGLGLGALAAWILGAFIATEGRQNGCVWIVGIGLIPKVSWGRTAVLAVGAVNALGAILAFIFRWEGAPIGLALSLAVLFLRST